MGSRSFKASEAGIKKAKLAFKRKQWTQEYLAAEVGLQTRQPIWKFFKGKPVDRHVFTEICFHLDLDPQEIIETPEISEFSENEAFADFETLVQKVRGKRYDKIQHQCGTLRLLDISRSIAIDELYIQVNILEEITSQRWIDLCELQGLEPEEFDRLGLGQVRLSGISGLQAVEKYPKLMVLGKPGAGKTTFLQHLAIQCNQGVFQPQQIPVFIRLKRFAEESDDEGNFSWLDYLTLEFSLCGTTTQEVTQLLTEGRVLLLLDGLDEVPENASDRVIAQISQFADRYYQNPIIVTCRIAAEEYRFQGFTEVEIADFTPIQVKSFAKKWFATINTNSPNSGLEAASLFLEQLEWPQNRQLRELAVTPILLNLTCLVFQAKGKFPEARSQLYQQGLDLLLVRWDETRGITRDGIYRELSLSCKLQLLSQIAAITFEQGEYFFEESHVQRLISDYLQTLPNTDPITLPFDSAAVLKAIEGQHGLLVERARSIYSFSHLTFQEYLCARAIVTSSDPDKLPPLVAHLSEKRWREVFLLTLEMLPEVGELLRQMKAKVDEAVLTDDTLQGFLAWVKHKSQTVRSPYHPAAIRAFYLTLALPPEHPFARNSTLALSIDPRLACELEGELGLDLALVHGLEVAGAISPTIAPHRLSALHLALDLTPLLDDRLTLKAVLADLKTQLPEANADKTEIEQWWRDGGQAWYDTLRTTIVRERNVGQLWQFTPLQQEELEWYCQGYQLLLDGLKSRGQTTLTVERGLIEDLFLLA